ncbi:putative transcription repressor PLATZ family [Helianthus anomalus]
MAMGIYRQGSLSGGELGREIPSAVRGTIRRYVLHDVIKRPDFQKYFDCSGIQGYQTNKNKVLFLKSRKDNQQQQNNKDPRCNICNQNLLDASYCSIQCKVFLSAYLWFRLCFITN